MEGTKITYNAQQDEIVQMQMYGLIRNDHNTVRVANRIFETMLYNLFLSDEELQNNAFTKAGDLEKNQFVADGKLKPIRKSAGLITAMCQVKSLRMLTASMERISLNAWGEWMAGKIRGNFRYRPHISRCRVRRRRSPSRLFRFTRETD